MNRKVHIPIRLCVGCRKRRKKEEMIRFTRMADGSAQVIKGRNQTGRGLYLCPEASCLKAAQKKRHFERLIIDRFEEGFGTQSIRG